MSGAGEHTPKGRDPETGQFRKGESGCPSGRPKGVVAISRATNLRDLILAAAGARGKVLAAERGLEIAPDSDQAIALYLEWLSANEPRSFSSLLAKILPLMPTKVALPEIKAPSDLVAASSAIAKAVSEGDLAPTEGSAIANIVGAVGKSIEIHVLEQRLAALEERLTEKGDRR